jgi:rubrerythrin
MKCEIDETEMEWVAAEGHPDGGYWHCEQCLEDEEAYFTTPETAGTEADWGPWTPFEDDEDDESRYCPHCGKEYEDFSDYGCPSCDVRV